MTSGQKIAFSLLVAMGLFTAFVLSLRTTLFKELETRYYTQSKIEEYTKQLNKISESCDSYITNVLNQIETDEKAWIKSSAVRSYYVQNPSESDVNQRRLLTEQLFKNNPALYGVRIVDKNGRNVHYSSFDDTDILKQTGITKFYKNYPDIQKDADEIAFETIEKKSNSEKSQILLDEAKNRMIFTVPFYWMDNVYSGQCLFYYDWSEIENELTASEVLSIGQKLTMFADDNYTGGFVYGLPSGNKSGFKNAFIKYWKKSPSLSPEKLLEMEDGRFWVALSDSDTDTVKVSGVYTSDVFQLSREVILLIYICIFISILLIVFLIFSINRDPEVVLKKRIKKIQYGIIKECIDNEDKLDWNKIARQLKSRKNDLSSEILKSLKVHSKKKRKELDSFLEQNWNDIFSAFEDKAAKSNTVPEGSSQRSELSGASIGEIRKVLEEVLRNTKINVSGPVSSVKVPVKPAAVAPVQEIEEAEEVLDDVEEIEEAEEVLDDVEEIEEAEEVLDDVEEIEEAEEVLDDAEEIEEAEEVLDDAEEIEEAEEVLDDVEEIEEAEEVLDDVEEIEEAEEVLDDAEEIEEAEEVLDDAEEIEEAEEVLDDVEEIEEAEEVLDDVEEIEEAEEVLDDAEEIEETEEVLDDAEEIEEADEVLEILDEAESDNPFGGIMDRPAYVYKPANDTYFCGDDFATVENVCAEELSIGCEIKLKNDVLNIDSINFTVYKLEKYPESEESLEEQQPEEVAEEVIDETADEVLEDKIEEQQEAVQELLEDIEELTEDVPPAMPYYSMTGFAENLTVDTPILEAANIPEGAIVESDGVYSISDDLALSDIEQDKDFKALVDSVL